MRQVGGSGGRLWLLVVGGGRWVLGGGSCVLVSGRWVAGRNCRFLAGRGAQHVTLFAFWIVYPFFMTQLL
ncbi:MAG: hypothetical protein GY820_30300 [Gammaproteobacteria bacterium]|nr:hypothetical protein [Gammaproteobacteria bacterium]